MRVYKENGTLNMTGVQKIIVCRDALRVDGKPIVGGGAMFIESESIAGFMVMSELAKGFEHMKCWQNESGEDCEKCPVKHNGTCAVTGIKNAAIKEGMAKGTINEPKEGL